MYLRRLVAWLVGLVDGGVVHVDVIRIYTRLVSHVSIPTVYIQRDAIIFYKEYECERKSKVSFVCVVYTSRFSIEIRPGVSYEKHHHSNSNHSRDHPPRGPPLRQSVHTS